MEYEIALVTGAGRGIGLAIVRKLAAQGMAVVVADIDGKAANSTADEICESGGVAFAVAVDVTDQERLEECRKAVAKEWGHVNRLVINAGITEAVAFADLTYPQWKKMLRINTDSAYLTCKTFVPDLLHAGRGSIVFVTSGSAYTGSGGGAHYTASKAAEHGLMRSLAREYGPKGIHVNAVAPRVILTPMLDDLYSEEERGQLLEKIAVGRLGTPEDVAEVVHFLGSPESSYLHGQVILLDGGRSLNS